MIRQLPRIPLVFASGKWQGIPPRELDFGDLCYVSRWSPSEVDRAIARQEIYRRLRAAKQRRFHDRHDVRQNGGV